MISCSNNHDSRNAHKYGNSVILCEVVLRFSEVLKEWNPEVLNYCTYTRNCLGTDKASFQLFSLLTFCLTAQIWTISAVWRCAMVIFFQVQQETFVSQFIAYSVQICTRNWSELLFMMTLMTIEMKTNVKWFIFIEIKVWVQNGNPKCWRVKAWTRRLLWFCLFALFEWDLNPLFYM